MNHSSRLLPLLVLLFGTSLQATTYYSITDIGPALYVSQVNDSGLVVGYNATGSFLWDGSQHILPNPAGGTFRANGINDLGQVVGQVSYPPYTYAIGLYQNGSLQVLGLGSGVAGSYINDSGQIAGDLVAQYRAALYSGGTYTTIGVLPGDGESTARAINNAGDVLVYSAGLSGHAAIYSHGTLTQVPGSAGFDVQPEGINNSGQVVGSVYNPSAGLITQAVLFSNGTATLLGALPESGPRESFANATNDQGIVVGETVGVSSKAMAFYQDLGLVDLNTVLTDGSGWSLQTAGSINDEGQIAWHGVIQRCP